MKYSIPIIFEVLSIALCLGTAAAFLLPDVPAEPPSARRMPKEPPEVFSGTGGKTPSPAAGETELAALFGRKGEEKAPPVAAAPPSPPPEPEIPLAPWITYVGNIRGGEGRELLFFKDRQKGVMFMASREEGAAAWRVGTDENGDYLLEKGTDRWRVKK
jgi:hypothetical protein